VGLPHGAIQYCQTGKQAWSPLSGIFALYYYGGNWRLHATIVLCHETTLALAGHAVPEKWGHVFEAKACL
jgi:hypothetical protein